jgi:hypothetical protein
MTLSGSALTWVQVSGVAIGATLNDGTHSFTASSGSTSVNMLGWSYTTLSIRPSNDKNFSLSVQATDSSGNSSPVATEVITVDPLAPTVAPASVSGTMGQPIALNLGIVPNGLAGDSNSLSSAKISGIPSGTTLGNANGDTLIVSAGSVTFSAGQLAAGALNGLAITPASSGSFSLTVAATEQDAQGYPQHHRHQQWSAYRDGTTCGDVVARCGDRGGGERNRARDDHTVRQHIDLGPGQWRFPRRHAE